MLNIYELERRWLRYKIKSFLPYIILVISIIVISISIFFLIPKTLQKNKTKTIVEKAKPMLVKKKPLKQKKAKIELKQVEKKATVIPNIQREKKSNKVTLSPSLGFMKKMQTDVQPYYKNETSQPIVEEKKSETVVDQKVIVKKETPTNKLLITHKNTHHDIAEIIKRFKKNNNPALSLFIAKKYYELGNYRESYNYALMTNEINNDIEISWIIFTKSLVKLGKKRAAIKTLKEYIQQSHSNNAQILLDEILSGKFK